MTIKEIIVGLALVSVSTVCVAQEEEAQINPNSLLTIPKYEQLYKIKVWRVMDLREKQNKGFFARGNEMPDLILKAIKSGEIADVYWTDSLDRKMSKEDFNNAITTKQAETPPAWEPAKDFYKGDRVSFNGVNYEATDDSKGKNPSTSKDQWQGPVGKAETLRGSDIYILKIVEDVIFDKRRSRQYYDMLGIGLYAFDEAQGLLKPRGWIKYKDVEKVFRNHVKEAIWFNRYNTAENRNYADAFLLRLFHVIIEKVENPDDDTIFNLYKSHTEGVYATDWEEMKMMEREHNLWEY